MGRPSMKLRVENKSSHDRRGLLFGRELMNNPGQPPLIRRPRLSSLFINKMTDRVMGFVRIGEKIAVTLIL